MQHKNYYTILGIKTSSSLKDIKTAYRNLAKKHHPDKNNGDKVSNDIFKEIHQAYIVLSNSNKRREYDLKLGIIHQFTFAKQHNLQDVGPYGFSKAAAEAQRNKFDFSGQTTEDGQPTINLFPFILSIIIAFLLVGFIVLYKV